MIQFHMSLNLKKLLKQLDVLLINEYDDFHKKIENILNIFFKNILYTNSLKRANELYENSHPAVIIVDINIRNGNAIEFIKEMRKRNKNIPILVVTENKETDNLLEAIKLNLIDYLLKPLDINKFIFCLNLCAKQIINSGEIITIINQNTKYNYIEKTIIYKNEKNKLTKNETRLMELFLSHKNKYITKEDILSFIWKDKEITESAFKSLISRLIKKVGEETITNSFGVGYGIFDKRD